MILFGPSGNSDSFYAEGFKSSIDQPSWLRRMKLDAYEYSCSRGVRIGGATAEALRKNAQENNIKISVHAPYYINFASLDPEVIRYSQNYILETAHAVRNIGGDRVIFHAGACGKLERKQAFENTKKAVYDTVIKVREQFPEIHICPETMGKKNQIGSLDEVLDLCLLDASMIPALDFGHLHAVSSGGLKVLSDFQRVFERVLKVLGDIRGRQLHFHYRIIEFTEKGGEKKHWTFEDKQFGPEFEALARCLVDYKISGTVISEARGTMAEDALKIKNIYESMK